MTTAGFEDELKTALREQDGLGTDEIPAPLTATDLAGDLVWDLVWDGAAVTRTKKAITAFGILDSFCGVLVRDDFGGYVSYRRAARR